VDRTNYLSVKINFKILLVKLNSNSLTELPYFTVGTSLVILKFVESVNTNLKKNNIQFVPTCLIVL